MAITLPSVNAKTGSYVTDHYYYPVFTAGNFSTKGMTAGRQYYVGPFIAKEDVTFNRIGINVTTGSGGGGDTAILGIYTDVGGLPSLLVGTNNAEVAIDAIAEVEATVSISLSAGKTYWATINCEANISLSSFASTNNVRDSSEGAFNNSNTSIKDIVAYASTLPAISAAGAGDFVSETQPGIWLRVV